MHIIVFGCGKLYKKYSNILLCNFDIDYFIDNNASLQGEIIDNRMVYKPEFIKGKDQDIILMSDFAFEMRDQLLKLGCEKKKIHHYKDILGQFSNKREILGKNTSNSKKSLLIASNPLGYHGVGIVSLRIAECAKKLGYSATIASSYYNQRYIKDANEKGIDIVIQEYMESAPYEAIQWMKDYDYIIFNSFQMIRCAIRIATDKSVILWLHENLDAYDDYSFWYEEIQSGIYNRNVIIYAVTGQARNNFFRNYKYKADVLLLPVPIEDWFTLDYGVEKKLVIALIGNVIQRKGHDILLDAVQEIPESIRNNILFVFIGDKGRDAYAETIHRRIDAENNMIMLGERSQNEVRDLLGYIDLIVVPSREETFSMVAAEAMMMGKPCIVSDKCGIVEYIDNGYNGFIFRSEDVTALRELIVDIYEKRDSIRYLGEHARELYLENFSMKNIEDNLITAFNRVS